MLVARSHSVEHMSGRCCPPLTLVLLDVSTSEESCLRVCVRLREASANALVSSTGRVSHISQPRQPLNPQPANDEEDVEEEEAEVDGPAAAPAAGGADDVVFSVFACAGGIGGGKEEADLARSDGEGERGAAAAAAPVVELDWRRGVFNMADSPDDADAAGAGLVVWLEDDDVDDDALVRLLLLLLDEDDDEEG